MATTVRTASRSGINIRHLQSGAHGEPAKRTSKTQPDRRRLLQECLRHLDDEWMAKQVSRNESIVEADSHLNYGKMNDGDGGWVGIDQAAKVEDVIEYGDGRIGNVYRKMSVKSFETTTMVSFLPKSLCEKVPDYYPVKRKNSDGTERVVGHRPRWVVKDMDAAKQYFDDLIEYLETEVLTGGHDAISGFAVNFDESIPHIHIMCDTFAPSPKYENYLRVEAQQMWGQHADVTVEREDPDTGEVKNVQITGRTKMRAYQANLRSFMLERGYDIEEEPDPVRSMLGDPKDEYAEAQAMTLEAETLGEEAESLMVEAAQSTEDTQMLADLAAAEFRKARRTTEQLTEDWENTERPKIEQEVRDKVTTEARAEWESEKAALVEKVNGEINKTMIPRAIEVGKSEGRTQGRAEAKAEFDSTEAPALRQKVREETEQAVRAELQPDMDKAAADRQEAATALAQAQARQQALDRREAKLDEDRDELEAEKRTLRSTVAEVNEMHGDAEVAVKEVLTLRKAMAPTDRQTFDKATSSRLKSTVAQQKLRRDQLARFQGDNGPDTGEGVTRRRPGPEMGR